MRTYGNYKASQTKLFRNLFCTTIMHTRTHTHTHTHSHTNAPGPVVSRLGLFEGALQKVLQLQDVLRLVLHLPLLQLQLIAQFTDGVLMAADCVLQLRNHLTEPVSQRTGKIHPEVHDPSFPPAFLPPLFSPSRPPPFFLAYRSHSALRRFISSDLSRRSSRRC